MNSYLAQALAAIAIGLLWACASAGIDGVIEVLPVVRITDKDKTIALEQVAQIIVADAKEKERLSTLAIALPAMKNDGECAVAGELVEKQITGVVQKNGYNNLRVVSPPNVYIRRKKNLANHQGVVEVARHYLLRHLGNGYSDVELQSVAGRKFEASDTTQWVPRLVSEKVEKRMCVWVDEQLQGSTLKSHPVWFEVSAYGYVHRLTRSVSEGELVRPEDYTAVKADVAGLQGIPIQSPEDFGRYRYRSRFDTGQIMFVELLQKRPAVVVGETVKVASVVGRVRIQTTALAKSEGEIGEKVTLMSLSSHELFRGRVIENGLVVVGENPQ